MKHHHSISMCHILQWALVQIYIYIYYIYIVNLFYCITLIFSSNWYDIKPLMCFIHTGLMGPPWHSPAVNTASFSHLVTSMCSPIVAQIWVNIGSSNALLPDGSKPLPKPVLTYQWGFVGIHLKAISKEMLRISIIEMSLKSTNIKLQLHFLDAKVLKLSSCTATPQCTLREPNNPPGILMSYVDTSRATTGPLSAVLMDGGHCKYRRNTPSQTSIAHSYRTKIQVTKYWMQQLTKLS